MEEKKTVVSRRSFLKGTGAAIGGLALGNATAALAHSGSTYTALPWAFPTEAQLKTAATSAPYNYADLAGETDAEAAKMFIKRLAFAGYFEKNPSRWGKDASGADMAGGCCYGAGKGLVTAFAAALGESPYTGFASDMFVFGQGGAFGWGTVCGALNGACAVINLTTQGKSFTNSSTGKKVTNGAVIDALMSWYQTYAFPSNDLNTWMSTAYATQYTSGKVAVLADCQVAVGSPLCHVSVSTWCEAAGADTDINIPGGVSYNSMEKKVRCAKLTADVAYQTYVLLKEFLGYCTAGTNAGVGTLSWSKTDQTDDCTDCHNGTGTSTQSYQGWKSPDAPTTAKMDSEQGKMACEMCHDMPDGKLGVTNKDKNKAPLCKDPGAGI